MTVATIDPRGVTASFLRRFLGDIKKQHPKTYRELTTKDVCDKVVVPRTTDDQSAYVAVIEKEAPGELGPANVFVSHAWRYKIVDVIRTMLEFAEQREKEMQGSRDETSDADGNQANASVYFWFDLFINNQNIAASLPQDWWSTTFKESIAHIGHVLLVLTPWNDPVPLTRAWCLWEIFCALSQENVLLTIQLPAAQRKRLRQAIFQDSSAIVSTLVHVQAERAEAWSASDRDMIFKAIQDSVGFNHLNEKVKDQMREWCLQQLRSCVAEMEEQGDKGRTLEYVGLCLQVATIMVSFGHCEDAIVYFDTGLEARRKLGYPDDLATANVLGNEGLAYSYTSQPQRAIECFRRGLAIYAEHADPLHPGAAMLYNNLGRELQAQGDSDGALEAYSTSLKIKRKQRSELLKARKQQENRGGAAAKRQQAELDAAVQQLTEGVATTYNNIGHVYMDSEQGDKARAQYEKALHLYTETLGDKHPMTAQALSSMGHALTAAGDFDAAMQHFNRALTINKTTFGARHASVGSTFGDLGNVLRDMGRYEEAVEHHRRALDIFAESLGPDHLEVGNTHNNLAQALADWKKTDEAVHAFEQSLAVFRGLGDGHHPAIPAVLNHMATALMLADRHAAAVTKFEEAADVAEEQFGATQPKSLLFLLDLGQAYADANRYSDALATYERVLARAEDERIIDRARASAARVLTKMGRWDEAIAHQLAVVKMRTEASEEGEDSPTVKEATEVLAGMERDKREAKAEEKKEGEVGKKEEEEGKKNGGEEKEEEEKMEGMEAGKVDKGEEEKVEARKESVEGADNHAGMAEEAEAEERSELKQATTQQQEQHQVAEVANTSSCCCLQ